GRLSARRRRCRRRHAMVDGRLPGRPARTRHESLSRTGRTKNDRAHLELRPMTIRIVHRARMILAAVLVIGAFTMPAAQTPAQVAGPGEVAARTPTGEDPPGTARVAGHVTGTDGSPLANTRVVLTNTRTGQTRSEDTDADGRYQFDAVSAGIYEASAEK